MAIIPGDFTASTLAQTVVAADKMFADDIMKADFEANVDVMKALLKEQTANVKYLEDGDKDRDVKITWMNSCSTVVEECDGDDCTLGGDELGTDSKVYDISICEKTGFTVDEMVFRTNEYSMPQAVAKGLLRADKILSERIAMTAVAKVESFKGVNKVTDSHFVNPATSETDVQAAEWSERLFAYLYRVGIQNKFSNPFLLSGTNLFEQRILVQAAKVNADGKGAAVLYNLIRTYFDLFNIDAVNSPFLKTYLINRGAIAFASKHYYNPVPTVYLDQKRWSMKSRNIQGLTFDVYYDNKCNGDTYKHNFTVKVKYDFFLNPLGCDETTTGVLVFNKIA